MKKSKIAILVLAGIVALGLFQSIYTVDQTETALVLQLGKPVSEEPIGPGLHFKLPFVQNVIYFDSRIQDYDAKPEEILTEDKKTMVVDSYSKWRITNPLQFYRKVKTIPMAMARLDDIIRSQLRLVLGQFKLIEVVSHKRQELMNEVTERTRDKLKTYGILVLDVRIKRTDLPEQNERAIFNRMRAEREREAKRYRAEGSEQQSRIKSQADKERAVILAEAQRQAQIIRGEGEANSTRIYAKALEQGPEFYSFKRSLEAYEESLRDNTRMIMTPDSEFLKFFQ